MRTLAAGIVILMMGCQAAQADFVLGGRASPPEAPPTDAGRAIPFGVGHSLAGAARPNTFFKTATGFGNQVPLSFACRQIVPPGIRVSYGPGVAPDVLVDWKGGDRWNRVLAAAVKPLGLRLVMSSGAVELRE